MFKFFMSAIRNVGGLRFLRGRHDPHRYLEALQGLQLLITGIDPP